MKIIIWIFLFCCVFGYSQEHKTSTWELLPKGRPFRLTFADPREIRMSLMFSGSSRLAAMIGNYFSLVSYNKENPIADEIVFGLEGAGYFSLRQAQSRFPLEHTDGLIGLYIEGKKNDFQWQFRYTHVSSHLSDGIEQRQPIAYSQEYASLRFSYDPNVNLHGYFGIKKIVNSTPKVSPYSIQIGGAYFLPLRWKSLTPYVATDIQWKKSVPYNPNFSAQLGLALNNPLTAYRSFRLFYCYYTGSDPRGQFFQEKLDLHSLGIEMQI